MLPFSRAAMLVWRPQFKGAAFALHEARVPPLLPPPSSSSSSSQRTQDTPRPTPHRTHRPIGRPGTECRHDNRGDPSQMVSMLQTQKEGMGGGKGEK